ncbi:MAG: hypothetical protein VX899_08560 [Myxococcota bacterium]|nr:hypothetical protein [Myxococcota bacterium]
MTPLPTLHPNARLDLHLHSTGSDGRFDPDTVLAQAVAGKIDVLALTDHDLPAQLPAGPQTIDGHDIHLLHAVELSGWHVDTELHILVYFPAEMPPEFRSFCSELAARRADRYQQALVNMGLDGVLESPDQRAVSGERAITRLHLAQAIVQSGHAENLRDAFSRYAGTSLGKVPPVTLSVQDAIQAGRDAGGLTVWAHPSLDQARAYLRDLVPMGIQGLEVYRPRIGGKTRRELGRFTRKYGLVATGGSDWHGWYGHRLGEFTVQAQQLQGFWGALQDLAA